MPEDRVERKPAVERRIHDIKKEDVRVKVVGVIVSKDEKSSSIILNDENHSISIILPSDDLYEKAKIGALIRVFGTVIPYDKEVELKAEIIQDMSRLDKDLYIRTYNI